MPLFFVRLPQCRRTDALAPFPSVRPAYCKKQNSSSKQSVKDFSPHLKTSVLPRSSRTVQPRAACTNTRRPDRDRQLVPTVAGCCRPPRATHPFFRKSSASQRPVLHPVVPHLRPLHNRRVPVAMNETSVPTPTRDQSPSTNGSPVSVSDKPDAPRDNSAPSAVVEDTTASAQHEPAAAQVDQPPAAARVGQLPAVTRDEPGANGDEPDFSGAAVLSTYAMAA